MASEPRYFWRHDYDDRQWDREVLTRRPAELIADHDLPSEDLAWVFRTEIPFFGHAWVVWDDDVITSQGFAPSITEAKKEVESKVNTGATR